jgi:hypothetical protein
MNSGEENGTHLKKINLVYIGYFTASGYDDKGEIHFLMKTFYK